MLENFAAAVRALPVVSPGRRAALDALLRQGLPTTDDEDWKYTDLSRLNGLAAEDIAPSPDKHDHHDFPATYDCGLDALNTALAGGRQARTIQGRAEFDTGLHQRLRLQVHGDAELVLHDRSHGRLATFFAAIDVAPNSRLQLTRIQSAGEGSHRLTRLKIALARDAHLDAVTVDFGEGFARHDLDVALEGPGAEARLHGLYLARGSAHIDNHTRIDHRAPHGTSREFFHGIAFDKARAVFNGKIVVHAGAQKTDSEQRVANLLLSPGAEVNAKPELEIYADDVKCAHGATFGQLDEDALFYLRSRGLSAEAARAMLTSAFACEVLERIADEPLRERVTRDVLGQLGRLGSDPNFPRPLP